MTSGADPAEAAGPARDPIRRMVHSGKEDPMLKYSKTLSSARAYGEAGRMDEWLHLYLNGDGENVRLWEGLKRFDRYYFSPALFPVRLFHRCAGPEKEMKYQIDKDWWAIRVADLGKSIQNDPEDRKSVV